MAEKRYCPNCGSEDIEPRHDQLWGFTKSPNIWECNDCGYTGLAPEGDPEGEDVEFEPGEDYPVDAAVGVKDWYAYVVASAVFFTTGFAAAVIVMTLLGYV
jgi:rubredoxin